MPTRPDSLHRGLLPTGDCLERLWSLTLRRDEAPHADAGPPLVPVAKGPSWVVKPIAAQSAVP